MFSVTVAQQTGTAKLLTLFQRFQTKVHTLRVNETKITGENAFIGDHLGLKVTMNQITTKIPCFGYTFGFLTRALTLRL